MNITRIAVLKLLFWLLLAVVIFLNHSAAYYYGVFGQIPSTTLSMGFTPPWWAYPGFGITSTLIIIISVSGYWWKRLASISVSSIAIFQAFFIFLVAYKDILLPGIYLVTTLAFSLTMYFLYAQLKHAALNA